MSKHANANTVGGCAMEAITDAGTASFYLSRSRQGEGMSAATKDPDETARAMVLAKRYDVPEAAARTGMSSGKVKRLAATEKTVTATGDCVDVVWAGWEASSHRGTDGRWFVQVRSPAPGAREMLWPCLEGGRPVLVGLPSPPTDADVTMVLWAAMWRAYT